MTEPKGVTFVVQHAKIMETIEGLLIEDAVCYFCQASPIVVVYRNKDKVVVACKAHEDIVLEMIERDNLCG